MAKGSKSFSDKMSKGKNKGPERKQIRVILGVKDPDNGAIRFVDRMTSISTEGNLDENLKKVIDQSF